MTDKLEREIETLKLENVALRERVGKLEGAHNVLSKRILQALNAPLTRSDPSQV